MRVKASSSSDRKRKKLFSITKGYFGRKKNVYRRAREAYLHSLTKMYKDRKLRKRDFRRLWITRISAAARLNGLNYSTLINGLKKANIDINRKILAEFAYSKPEVFAAIVKKAMA